MNCTCLSISRDPLCVYHGDQPIARLRAEIEALEKWKADQQSALLAIAAELAVAQSPHDGVVEGVQWLGEVNQQLVARVRELETTRTQAEQECRSVIANNGWGQRHAVNLANYVLAALAPADPEVRGAGLE